MGFIPWRKVESWACSACGECCRWFKVPLMVDEHAFVLSTFGPFYIDLDVDLTYLARRLDGRCIFQFPSCGRWFCGLQKTKPLVCKLWPFIVTRRPRHGHSELASFGDGYFKCYVYVDPKCRGIRWGEPSSMMVERILPEVLKISLEKERGQTYSTSRIITPFSGGGGQIELSLAQPWTLISNRARFQRDVGAGRIANVASSVMFLPSRMTLRTTRSPGLLSYSR